MIKRRGPNLAPTTPSSPALRVLVALLGAAITFVVGAVLPSTVASLSGGVIVLDATLKKPFGITQGENHWQLEALQTSGTIGYPDVVSGSGVFQPRAVRGEVTLGRTDGTGIVIYRACFDLIGLAVIVGLVMLRRVVVSARDGKPFARLNITRLRVAGLSTLTIAFVAVVTESALATVVDAGSAVQLEPRLLPRWPFVLLSAGTFALAEIFRRGAELHDFDQLAI